VHLAGQPCDLDAIYATANRHNIAVIEDAAHALGAHYTTRAIGEATRYACFSFYAIKNITTIEGGAIATNDEETAKRLRLLASNGMSATAWDRYGRSAAPGPSEVVVPGYKYLMGSVSAAMGLVQLRKWPQFKTDRATLAARYLELLAEVEDAAPLAVRPNRVNAWHLMIVRLDLQRLTRTRDEIAQALRRENIGTGVHFYGLHLHQYYRETLGMRAEDFPEATAASRAILSLPLYPAMTETDVEHVVAALKKVLKHAAL
jgi:dTDP-4-amino-4,6-dideoxygalactose transaminase